jgi:hypothetical protein
MPWSILTVVAPLTVQFSDEDAPAEIVEGSALKEFINGSSLVVVTVTPDRSQPVMSSSASKNKGTIFFIFLPPKCNLLENYMCNKSFISIIIHIELQALDWHWRNLDNLPHD